MTVLRGRVHNLPPRVSTLEVRAVADVPGPPSRPVRVRPTGRRRARQARINDQWRKVSPFALALAIQALQARTTDGESGFESHAAEIVSLGVGLEEKAEAEAVSLLEAQVQQNADGLVARAADVTRLDAEIAGETTARTAAIQGLTVRVAESEGEIDTAQMGILANAAEITALEASIGGRGLGPVQNTFVAGDRAAAEALRDAYAAANPAWLADYDADDDINIELKWGVLYVYQRRAGDPLEWTDNGEVLASAAAVTMLNAMVQQQGLSIAANSASLTSLMATLGDVSAATFQELVARVDTNTGGLARWLVQTTVGGLTGGVGLVNDGDTVRFTVAADRFAVVPPNAQDLDDQAIPFIIQNGTVYIDSAMIRAASITALQAQNAFLTNLTAAHGELAQARIGQGNIFDLAIGNRIISNDYEPGVSGYRLDRSGVEFARGVQGDLRSVNYSQQAGSEAGWLLRADGTVFINSTAFIGRIVSDVFNAVPIYEGERQDPGTSGTVFELTQSIDNFVTLLFFIDALGFNYDDPGGQPGNAIGWYDVANIESEFSFFELVSTGVGGNIRRDNDMQLTLRRGNAGYHINQIIGIKHLP